MHTAYIKRLNLIRAQWVQRNMRCDDDDGRWVTTEEDHRLHINGNGEIDKGNPYVINAIKAFKEKQNQSIPVGARVKKGDEYFVKYSNGDFINPETGEVLDSKDLANCKRDCESQVKDRVGNVIDISHCLLEYGGKTELPPKVRASIEAFEKKRKKAKIEYGCLLDENGNTIGYPEYKGSHGSVHFPVVCLKKAQSVTHIHPRKDGSGMLGGTFSTADLQTLKKYPITTIRAAASEGIYSLKCGKDMDRGKFFAWATSEYDKHEIELNKALEPLNSEIKQKGNDYKAGKITYYEYLDAYSEYEKKVAYSCNAFVVACHNTLLSGQEKFGYHYTLERDE